MFLTYQSLPKQVKAVQFTEENKDMVLVGMFDVKNDNQGQEEPAPPVADDDIPF